MCGIMYNHNLPQQFSKFCWVLISVQTVLYKEEISISVYVQFQQNGLKFLSINSAVYPALGKGL
jgi:hypothetical protein